MSRLIEIFGSKGTNLVHDCRHTAISLILRIAVAVLSVVWPTRQVSAGEPGSIVPQLQQFCFDCHGNEDAAAGINLQQLATEKSFAVGFRDWQRVISQLKARRMPPKDAEQPGPAEQQQLLTEIRGGMQQAISSHADDPGNVVIRRLTSAEYGYTILDLTGLDLDVHRGFVSDAVGGAGFTNTGISQFVQDSTLQRYLEAAKQVAQHAVIGAGPLTFHQDPGQTGFELSAISRIQEIYRSHGFRSAAGEGGEPFGLDKYPRAFYAAWQIQHQRQLGGNTMTLASIAADAGVDVRFARHIHQLMTQTAPSFPTSEIVGRWMRLPIPGGRNEKQMRNVRAECDQIGELLLEWQNRFGSNPDAKEEAPVLRADMFDVTRTQEFDMNMNWPEGTKTAHLVLSIESAIRDGEPDAVVIWRNPQVQFRIDDTQPTDLKPLRTVVESGVVKRLSFGTHPREGDVEPGDFVTVGTNPPAFELPVPANAGSARLVVTAELDVKHGENCIVRCTISQLEETDQGKSVSGLLANPQSQPFAKWKAGVLEFARQLPQVSQREPAPSDRDPIPPLVDPSYNNPERNHYHIRIKYDRDDHFLVENMLDDATRRRLDQAWADLLGSFEFHDEWLQFLARKFQFQLDGRLMANLDDTWISGLPPAAHSFVQQLHRNYQSIQTAFEGAQPQHVEDVLRLAAQAWRRPLSRIEQNRLTAFYESLRADSLDHRAALRTLISRVLVAPEFLYRAERIADTHRSQDDNDHVPLNDYELASRLSYFLWSSIPDDELRRAAAAGELADPTELARQSRRMLRNPRAKRFATEFFGQWFGFYRFDQHRGIAPKRFPEFSPRLKSAMYNEAIAFFDHIVRNDRSLNEILFADYSFLNDELATHYGVEAELRTARDPDAPALDDPVKDTLPTNNISTTEPAANEGNPAARDETFQKVDGLAQHHRGGLLRLGAVLTVTSAPLRTSPVKRGDWILRRILGTPVPPPPADAGSIAADDVLADGLSVRQRLEAHRSNPSCVNCHSRIDALGFALENYDPLGRWRAEYRDGIPIDTSGELRDGRKLTDAVDLHEYLAAQRSSFHHNLSTKLLGYALGRRDLVGDIPLLEKMDEDLADDGSITGLVENIVVSRQFRYHQAGSNAVVQPSSE